MTIECKKDSVAMAIYEEKIINIPGFTIALKMWNPQSTKPVLCLHGKLDNAASFDLLAPLLPDHCLVAVDYPGVGFSSSYPMGVIPYWKNDAFLMLHLIEALEWEHFDIIAHSLGSLLATTLAMARPHQVGKIVFLDILGPTVNFIEKAPLNLVQDVVTYLTYEQRQKTVFPNLELAIRARMKKGNISYRAAQALVNRGAKQSKEGWRWTFDERLQCVGSTVPFEDELRAMFKGIEAPVCLIRANQGVPYPENIFQERADTIKNLRIHHISGGHHVHMDDPLPVAKIISHFFSEKMDEGSQY